MKYHRGWTKHLLLLSLAMPMQLLPSLYSRAAPPPRTCNGGGLQPLQHRARQVESVHIPAAAAVLLQPARQGQPLPGRQFAVQWRGLPVIAGPAAGRKQQGGRAERREHLQPAQGSTCAPRAGSCSCACACGRRADRTGQPAAARGLTCLQGPPSCGRGSGTAGCRRSGTARPRGNPPAAPCTTSGAPNTPQVRAAMCNQPQCSFLTAPQLPSDIMHAGRKNWRHLASHL